MTMVVSRERGKEKGRYAHARATSSQNEGANYRGVVVEHGSGVVNGHGGDWGKLYCMNKSTNKGKPRHQFTNCCRPFSRAQCDTVYARAFSHPHSGTNTECAIDWMASDNVRAWNAHFTAALYRSGWGTHGVCCSGGGVGNSHGGGLIHCRTTQDMHSLSFTRPRPVSHTRAHTPRRDPPQKRGRKIVQSPLPPQPPKKACACGVDGLGCQHSKQSMVAGYARDWKDCFRSTNLAISANMSNDRNSILSSFIF